MAAQYLSHYPLLQQEIVDSKTTVIQAAVNCGSYGVHAALFIAAVAYMSHRKSLCPLLTVAIAALFISSTIAVVGQTVIVVIEFGVTELERAHIVPQIHKAMYAIGACHRFNFLVGDMIVVWRAWVVWPGHRLARFLLALCACGSVAGTVTNGVWEGQSVHGTRHTPELELTLIMALPLLATNLVASILIAIRFWTYWRTFGLPTGLNSGRNEVKDILLALIESSALYCILWIIYMATALCKTSPGKLSAFTLIQPAYHTLAGIYPTSILLIVTARRAAAESHPSTGEPNEPIRFTPGTRAPTRTFSETVGTSTDAGQSHALRLPATPKKIGDLSHGSRTLLGDGNSADENGGDEMELNSRYQVCEAV